MPSSTVENYLKEILLAAERVPGEPVSMGEVARALGVVPGTATTMVKHLARRRFLDYTPRVGVRLTTEGETLAIGVLRRHRLVEHFLVETLGLSWDTIHEEAERLEHAVSDRVLDALDRFLGHPVVDPHGDPIPTAHGVRESPRTRPLSSCAAGSEVVVERILDQEGAFLRFADERGLRPGARMRVLEHTPEVGAMTVAGIDGGAAFSLSLDAAKNVLVAR